MISNIGLVLAVAFLIVGAYKGMGALPLTILAGLIVIVTSQMPLWDSYANYYMSGYTSAYFNYFLLFTSSALYAEFMNVAGTATAIGYKFIDWFGKDRVLLVSLLIISVLTYGGVSLFVVVFAVAPIMFLLFKEADIPRHLTMGCLIGGSATFTMTAMPGSPQLANVVPTQYLGTTLTAAPLLGSIASIILFTMIMFYLNFQLKRSRSKDEHWTEPEGELFKERKIFTREELPNVFQAFTPIIVLVLIIIVGSYFVEDSTMLATVAMLIGAVLTMALNYSKFTDVDFIQVITRGTGGGITSIGGIAAVVAFGSIVQNSPAFEQIVDWLLSLNINPYLQGVIATAVIAGVTGSSSGGQIIMYDSLASHFLNTNIVPAYLHRLTAIAAGSLDTLPHSPGLFVMFPSLGLTHKDAYIHVFAISVVIPGITVALMLAYIIFLG